MRIMVTRDIGVETELSNAAQQLYNTRKALKVLGEQEDLLKGRVKELVSILEYDDGIVRTLNGLQLLMLH